MHIPKNGGIVKESKVSHALDQVRFCIYFALLDRHTRHMHRRMGRILCDGEDEVDGWVIPTSMKRLVSKNSDESLEFPGI